MTKGRTTGSSLDVRCSSKQVLIVIVVIVATGNSIVNWEDFLLNNK